MYNASRNPTENAPFLYENHDNEKLDSMCGYTGSYRHVYFWGFVFLFSHARIGLLIEPGRETEKLIIVP